MFLSLEREIESDRQIVRQSGSQTADSDRERERQPDRDREITKGMAFHKYNVIEQCGNTNIYVCKAFMTMGTATHK